MSQDQSPAVIDATDAQVFTERQSEELDKCQFHLNQLRAKITAKENEVIYLYVEAGWWFLRARAVHRCETVSHRSNGTFDEQQDTGFYRWFDAQKFHFTIRTAQSWMRAAETVGLAVESTILALQTLREEKRLHGKYLKDLRPPKRHEPAVEIIDKPDPDADAIRESVRLSWMERQEGLNQFFDGWSRATWSNFVENEVWLEVSEQTREDLEAVLYKAYQQMKDFRLKEEARKLDLRRKKEPVTAHEVDQSKAPPKLEKFRFEFEKPRGSRKLKGSRWFYGYQAPEGGIKLIVYRGETTEAAAEEFKKSHPDVQLVGPFFSTSTRYAQYKVKEALSGRVPDTTLSKEIDGEIIGVPKA